jgi:hypothetical protein
VIVSVPIEFIPTGTHVLKTLQSWSKLPSHARASISRKPEQLVQLDFQGSDESKGHLLPDSRLSPPAYPKAGKTFPTWGYHVSSLIL